MLGRNMSMLLEIRPDLKAQLDCLAVETHRSEAELVNEALENGGFKFEVQQLMSV